jgi:thymidylate synthase ThyX
LISANIVLDSTSRMGNRLTTFELVLPKQLLAQLNTHRSLSKNAASSRAIPTKTFLKSIQENPVMPVWTENKPGMVGDKIEDRGKIEKLNMLWIKARNFNMEIAAEMVAIGGHKQTVNRLLEPWFYAKIVCSATELDWFYYLRDSGSAQEEIAILARCMKEAQASSTPTLIEDNEWHIPFILPDEQDLPVEIKLKISVARCARVSYKTYDTGLLSTIEKDIKLYNQLFEEKHLSPFEHQATPALTGRVISNYRGWVQLRKGIGG